MSIGGMLVNNLILLGVYTELVKPILPELIEEELDRTYGDREAVLNRNKQAFRKGLELAKTVAG
jgi:Pyruvate/2-oxoacid:ferredoxin oxidoreductase gamma subunit